jgi:uncharacterized membrane protein YphA (DoxX/SURF4 family)
MRDIALACAWVLGAVFLVAGVSKLRRRGDTERSFARMELPAPRVLSVVVPIVEIALAVVIVEAPSAAGWGAFALLVAFSVVLARAIARGSDAPCACFGSGRSEPVSTSELVRNAMLAALAIVATGATRESHRTLAAFIVVTLAFVLGRVLLAGLDFRRQAGRLWPRIPS